MIKMSINDLIDFIRAGKWEINLESECYCQFDWRIEDSRLIETTQSDECWIGNVLYINDEAVAQEIQGEAQEQLIELCDYDDTVYPDDWDLFDILQDLNPEILDELRLSNEAINEEHRERQYKALVKWLSESGYDLYINPERGFSNEYTCILAAKDTEVDANLEPVTAKEWAGRYLNIGDAATTAYVGFALIA
ncbi:hypothetical protein [Syntrophomonas palmitatica]|uniref:hypothetical protein n=1 Tax=Syntrophomonas palmitatica TaxID=402877 RepID=UPI0006CF69F8|nr:hypothetical protein [Syntrophomonas palmitatica]